MLPINEYYTQTVMLLYQKPCSPFPSSIDDSSDHPPQNFLTKINTMEVETHPKNSCWCLHTLSSASSVVQNDQRVLSLHTTTRQEVGSVLKDSHRRRLLL
jgi:hypothetical protein